MTGAWNLVHLNDRIRNYMRGEFDGDVIADRSIPGSFYRSKNFNEHGAASCVDLMRDAIHIGDCDSLTTALNHSGFFRTSYVDSRGRNYTVNTADAAMKYAHGEFNRFYLRGLCLAASDDCVEKLVIYRAKVSLNARSASEHAIGTFIFAAALLADLRANKGLDPHLGLPPGAHSGLSAKYPAAV